MTKHEADVIGGLNMTDQISNEAYKQIMIAAQDENEVGDVLDKIRAEIEQLTIADGGDDYVRKMAELFSLKMKVLQIIDKYREGAEK